MLPHLCWDPSVTLDKILRGTLRERLVSLVTLDPVKLTIDTIPALLARYTVETVSEELHKQLVKLSWRRSAYGYVPKMDISLTEAFNWCLQEVKVARN